ncbi:hypothetical protein [Nitrospirillum amazonense]|uniref:PIN-like domain-containing protein n=1 Tax=Nitrospirillum amazonense TaxID=28077 RepID=UPI00241229E6|nr:hypothetical protein [Nitrospirillum amazonense]MDG3440068.1 hypothetical protein [Nitrospirillum amazonense]
MKICADEHISPKILRAVKEIVLSRSFSLFGVADLEFRGTEDEYWISTFARNGGNAILSCDRKMLKRDSLLTHIQETGLIAIYFPEEWAMAKRHFQAAHTLFWWPKIEETINTAPSGSIWIMPPDFGNRSLKQYIKKIPKSERAKERIKSHSV